jgi:hypothetical protein
MPSYLDVIGVSRGLYGSAVAFTIFDVRTNGKCAGYVHHLAGGLLATIDTSGADLVYMITAAMTSKSGRLKQMVP